MADGRLPLSESLIRKQFLAAMSTLRDNKLSLSDYDRKLFSDLDDGYNFAGSDLGVTVKQFNHIRQVAMELEQLDYRS